MSLIKISHGLMRRSQLLFLFMSCLILFYLTHPLSPSAQEMLEGEDAEEEKEEVTLPVLQEYCLKSYVVDGKCPPDICRLEITEDEVTMVMSMYCLPKTCVELPADHCPTDICQIMVGCDDEPVCYDQMDRQPPLCGELAYSGQDVECCKGFIKRCGVEFFDGSCDMLGKNSIYSIPICIPCGNGICNQFENRCNCPEDCKKK